MTTKYGLSLLLISIALTVFGTLARLQQMETLSGVLVLIGSILFIVAVGLLLYGVFRRKPPIG
ncbi:hypothetical protein EXU57_24380 [Segetibacter sp. 3557_3]|uniref:hypothetical protein n=1 Tax=Segetibacter sp. 3557_3 TaxID=2547429 RepID=UPI001058CEA2|nr:hypothetical protein [Segetibacter sp. 3557_3]TDH18061.1 hypothetical protein EXU57_24380 [Segetibacter sp. 3557_3]